MDLDRIVIRPILIQKGETKLALYGLGNMRDERLNRAINAGKVEVLELYQPARLPNISGQIRNPSGPWRFGIGK